MIERLRKIRIKEEGFGDKDVYPVKPVLFYKYITRTSQVLLSLINSLLKGCC